MKNAVFALLILLAAVPTTAGAAPAAATDYLPRLAPMADFHGFTWGYAQVKLRVESGIFALKSPGRLRTYPRRYTYTVSNQDFWGGLELVLDRFLPSACGQRYLALPPTQLTGEFGEPEAWKPSTWQGPSDRTLSWSCDDPWTQAIFPQSSYQFQVYSEADPGIGSLVLEGWGVDETFFPHKVKSEILYTVPGCVAAPPALTPEWDLEAAIGPAQVSPGHTATVTLRARNVGRAQATNTTFHVALPQGLAYVPGSLTRDGAPVADGGMSPFGTGVNVGALPADGRWAQVGFRARVAAGVPEGALLSLAPRLTCDQTESLDAAPVSLKVGPSDRTPPAIQILSPLAGTYAEDQAIEIRFQVSDADPGLDESQTKATLDGRPIENGTRVPAYTLAPGAHTLAVTAADTIGNRQTVSVRFEVAVTLRTTIDRVLHLRDTGQIRTEQTMGTLNALLLTARARLQAGDRQGAIDAIDAFRRVLTNPIRKHLIDESAVALLTASADYLMANPTL